VIRGKGLMALDSGNLRFLRKASQRFARSATLIAILQQYSACEQSCHLGISRNNLPFLHFTWMEPLQRHAGMECLC